MTTTIPVSEEIKKILERIKGRMTWDEFLEYLINEVYKVRRERNRAELNNLFKSTAEEVRVKKWAREH
jgi:predicted CopG family antitoxin